MFYFQFVLLFELFIPLVLFVILLSIRKREPARPQNVCKLNCISYAWSGFYRLISKTFKTTVLDICKPVFCLKLNYKILYFYKNNIPFYVLTGLMKNCSEKKMISIELTGFCKKTFFKWLPVCFAIFEFSK